MFTTNGEGKGTDKMKQLYRLRKKFRTELKLPPNLIDVIPSEVKITLVDGEYQYRPETYLFNGEQMTSQELRELADKLDQYNKVLKIIQK